MFNSEILDRNKKTLRDVKFSLKRGYRRLNGSLREPIMKEVGSSSLEETFTLGEQKNGTLLFASSIPSIAFGAISAVGSLGVVFVGASLLLNLGYTGSQSDMLVLKEVEKTFMSIADFTSKNLSRCILSLAIPFSVAILSMPCKLVKTVKENTYRRQYEKKKADYDLKCSFMMELDDIVQLVTDIENDRDDVSLVFVKSFFKNVDLTQNSNRFNFQILSGVADYRSKILKEKDQVGSKEETDEAFLNFIHLLSSATLENGASKNFIDNEYVQTLVNTYSGAKKAKYPLKSLTNRTK